MLIAKLLTMVTLSFVMMVLIPQEYWQAHEKWLSQVLICQLGQISLSIGVILYFPCKTL
jgi:hypothetical protein